MDKYIQTPLTKEKIEELKVGDFVYIRGTIYTARDAAHKRLYHSIMKNEEIPIDLKNNVIYYLGPTPNKVNEIIGSAGPTTSSRMDKYTPKLLKLGLKGMIGKGKRNNEVIQSIIENKGIYFTTIGGAGSLLSTYIKKSKVIAYEDLGPEAIYELYVENFPTIVTIDAKGNNLYESSIEKYRICKSLNEES